MRHREWGLPLNARVLACLEGKSAHSDIAAALSAAVRPLGDARQFWARKSCVHARENLSRLP
jgi:hypothetical protein